MTEKKQAPRMESDTAEAARKMFADLQGSGSDSAARLYIAWMEGLSDLGNEAVQFVAERIAEDVKTQHAILNCKSPAELVAIQRAFLQKALDQYVAEGGKLARMGTEILRSATLGREN